MKTTDALTCTDPATISTLVESELGGYTRIAPVPALTEEEERELELLDDAARLRPDVVAMGEAQRDRRERARAAGRKVIR